MTDIEIIRSQVLLGESETMDDQTSGFFRMTVTLCATLCIVLLVLVAQSGRLQVVSDFGIPVQLKKTQCAGPEAGTSTCFLLTSRQALTVTPGDRVILRLLGAPSNTRPLAQFIVMERSGSAWQVKSATRVDAFDGVGSTHASLVTGQRKTSPAEIVLDGWRRLLG